MMDIVLKAFLTACGAGMLTLIIVCIKWFANKIKQDIDKEKADDMTLKALAHDAYFRHCRYLEPERADRPITQADYENHCFLYKAYKSQGLNDVGDKMHEMIAQKNIVPSPILFDANDGQGTRGGNVRLP